MIVRIPAARIHDWVTFHDVFAELFGFPDFYGRNMDAWIDFMSHDVPDAEMTLCQVKPGQIDVALEPDDLHGGH